MNFVEHYPIEELRPADYNPRLITPEAFEKLKVSLQKFGVVKPVILNGTGVVTAGHQRIKAMKAIGLKTTPAIILENISLHDEIKFNLFHNSIETSKSEVVIRESVYLPPGFSFVFAGEFKHGKNLSASVSKSIGELYLRYGNWGSVVVDTTGRVIVNSDYAIMMKRFNEALLVYRLEAGIEQEFLQYMELDYGSYHYKALNIKPYVQLHCQMNRVKEEGAVGVKSTLYEKHIIPNLDKGKRYLDFGAGKFVYVNYLQSKGYDILGYEPYTKKNNHEILIGDVIRQLDKIRQNIIMHGLFDVVILDSVINSVTSLNYENYVLTACNALLKPSGRMYMATRCIESVARRMRAKIATQRSRAIEFLDAENFSATFRQGNWTLQRFHSQDSLKALLLKYFGEVTISTGPSQHYAICSKPVQFPPLHYSEALETELNMEYPENFKHNKHETLVKIIMEKVCTRR